MRCQKLYPVIFESYPTEFMIEPTENEVENTSLPATEPHPQPASLSSAETSLSDQSAAMQSKEDKKQEGFSIRLLEKRVSAGFSILAKVAIIIIILLAMIFIGRQLADTGYTIKQVNMPVAFEEAGYTGPVVADKITSTLARIIDKVKVSQSTIEYVNLSAEADVSVDLVGVGVPIRSVINLLGEAIGVNHSKTITTSITTDADTLIVTTHISGEAPEQFKFEMHGGKEAALKKAVEQASYTILKYTAPDILGLHLVDAKDQERGIVIEIYAGAP